MQFQADIWEPQFIGHQFQKQLHWGLLTWQAWQLDSGTQLKKLDEPLSRGMILSLTWMKRLAVNYIRDGKALLKQPFSIIQTKINKIKKSDWTFVQSLLSCFIGRPQYPCGLVSSWRHHLHHL